MTLNLHGNPLAQPTDNEVLTLFTRHFRLARYGARAETLARIAATFAQLPYENLTKIINASELGSAEQARRSPAEVMRDHVALGAGGTCFSLTATLLHLLRALGWQAEPILADRSYGQDTHSALLVWIGRKPHLVDPGYLIVRPISLSNEEQRVRTPFNEIVLKPNHADQRAELWTIQQGNHTYRLTYKTSPVDAAEFLRAWDASFEWDMMRYPLLTRVGGANQLYLQGNRFQVRNHHSVERCEIAPAHVIEHVAREFGIHTEVTARALAILKRRET